MPSAFVPVQPAVQVTVAKTRGSTPREQGSSMLVWQDGFTGSIGGGNLELHALEIARSMLASPSESTTKQQRFSLGAGLGQCCGGTVELCFEYLSSAGAMNHCPQPHLAPVLLFGAGHVGRALVRAIAHLPFELWWVDSRENEFLQYCAGQSFPDLENSFAVGKQVARIHLCLSDTPEIEVGSAPAGAAFVIMTHSHALDLSLCEAVLRRLDVGFLGMIGSRTKRQKFLGRLMAKGYDGHGRLICPIGVAGIVGKDPHVIAASVAAQLLQWRSAPAIGLEICAESQGSMKRNP